jgi:hypothetical protein
MSVITTFLSDPVQAFANAADSLVRIKGALWCGKILSALGLTFMAQHFVYDPLIDQAQAAWSTIPAGLAAWVHALGIDTCISLLLSAYGIRGASRIFVQRVTATGAP